MSFESRIGRSIGECAEVQDLFRSLVDRQQVGIAIYEPLGREDLLYRYANAAFEAFRPNREIVGHRYTEVYPELGQVSLPRFFDVLDTGRPWVERDQALEVEIEPGVRQVRYYDYDVGRLEIDGEWFLFSVARDTTDEVKARQAEERLHAAVQDELSRTSVLLEVAAASSELDVREVAEKVLETAQRLLGAISGIVYVLDDVSRILQQVALRGYRHEVESLFEEVPLDDESISGQAVLRNRLLTYRYDELPPATRRRADDAGEAGSTWVAIPAHARGHAGGSITLVFDPDRTIADEDLSLFEGVGDQLGVAMENARLFEMERDRARFGASMVEISASLASSLSIEETLPAVLDQVRSEVRAYVVAVADRVETGWRIRDMAGEAGPVFVPGFVFADAQAPTLMRLLRQHEADLVPDVMEAPHANRRMAEMAKYRAYVAQPLISHGRVDGALGVFFSEPRSPSATELDYFRRVAFAISLAEENARLYEAEHRIAETLQTALLALPESVPGVEFTHLYRSASEAARVGGDFYDLFELEHRKVGVTIGDISGHGVDAAVQTSLVKNAIRVRATQQSEPRPDRVMATASKLLYDNSPSEIFATVFFGVLDLDTGLLQYCSAGHTTGACICGTGGVRRLHANSPLMGAFADEPFETSTEHVAPGDLLFLYTDGLTEARRDHELFGEERLFALLDRERGGDPQRTLRTVVDAVLDFTGGQLFDDLAILAVQRP